MIKNVLSKKALIWYSSTELWFTQEVVRGPPVNHDSDRLLSEFAEDAEQKWWQRHNG